MINVCKNFADEYDVIFNTRRHYIFVADLMMRQRCTSVIEWCENTLANESKIDL